MHSTIRFLRPYQGRMAGAIDSLMGYGVHDALVRRGVAEFFDSATPMVAAGISEPRLSSDPLNSNPNDKHGERKLRRNFKKENV